MLLGARGVFVAPICSSDAAEGFASSDASEGVIGSEASECKRVAFRQMSECGPLVKPVLTGQECERSRRQRAGAK